MPGQLLAERQISICIPRFAAAVSRALTQSGQGCNTKRERLHVIDAAQCNAPQRTVIAARRYRHCCSCRYAPVAEASPIRQLFKQLVELARPTTWYWIKPESNVVRVQSKPPGRLVGKVQPCLPAMPRIRPMEWQLSLYCP
jgi:hypothetical protein